MLTSNKEKKELVISNTSALSNSSLFEDKYPLASSKSPKFD
jgi:hypothetical protein